MSSFSDSIRQQALDLTDGRSMRGTCPKCGSSGTSFCITRQGNELRFIDFSASCGFKGVVLSSGDIASDKSDVRCNKRPVLDTPLTSLTKEEYDKLSNMFRVPSKHLKDVRYCEKDGRVYYPMFSGVGKLQSYIARAYEELAYGKKQIGAKAINKPVTSEVTGLCFPSIACAKAARERGVVAVVEDWPSAARLWAQLSLPTACLGGTNLLESHISTLMGMDIRELFIILDADAIQKAVKVERSVSVLFTTKIIPLTDKDPKDMTVKELANTFKDL